MEDFKRWLEKAEEDFDTAKYNLEGGKTNASFFFMQQSAEKALKAVYIKKFRELLKTHDLFILAKKLNAPERVIEYCKKLSPAYQYTRYPDIIKADDVEEFEEEFLIYCGEIIKWCKENL
ncbi:MAG: HEPN domain-containing protein [Candidatus Pacearchaeota archaeon]|jgi:HEPN domain-containing protein